MLTRSQDATREAAEHKCERPLFSFAIGKSNCHHGVIVALDFVKGKNLPRSGYCLVAAWIAINVTGSWAVGPGFYITRRRRFKSAVRSFSKSFRNSISSRNRDQDRCERGPDSNADSDQNIPGH